MTDFSTQAELSLTVPDAELRNVRQQIESEIGTTEIGMTDGGTMSAQASRGPGSGGGRARRRARRSFRMEVERTEYLEQAVVYLEDIEDKVGSGGGEGILDDVVGALVETGGDAAIEAGDTVLDVATDAASTALGNAIADAVTENDLSVEKPEWVPIPVEEPGGGGISINADVDLPEFEFDLPEFTFNPEFQPTFNPEISVQPEFHPEFNPTFEPELSPEIDLPELTLNFPSRQQRQSGNSPNGGARPPTTQDDDKGAISIGGEDGINIGGGEGVRIGSEDSGIQIGGDDDQSRRTRTNRRGETRSRKRTTNVTVNNKSRAKVTIDPSGIDELQKAIDEVRDAHEQNIEDLRSELETLERDVENLETAISKASR